MKNLKPVVSFCLTSLLIISIAAQESDKMPRLIIQPVGAQSLSDMQAPEPEKKPRVFITDSQSWEIAGGFSATKDAAAGQVRGGARPQTAEVIKTFGEKCPDVTVTMNAEKADYVVMLEREGAKALYLKDNKFAVFKADGDAIKSGSTRTLGNAVKDACAALVKDWQEGKK